MPSMNFLSEKARKPKFELHLKIYDLNNVPLVSGTSIIKWHLTNSIHAEHRGRTDRCPIANHVAEYNYSKIISSIRIPIDKNANLGESIIEFEVLQEFAMAGGAGGGGGGSSRDEKMVLGMVRLNLSEYVEESDGLVSRKRGGMAGGGAGGAMPSPTSLAPGAIGEEVVEEGIVRRYLMQDSKVNSTLKMSILMVQIDGERNYVAPPLRTAPVFGGIAGIMSGEQVEQDDAGQLPSISKPRDAAEVQDMYRRALAASWSAQPGELSADEVIENIFAGGDGWSLSSAKKHRAAYDEDSGSISGDEGMGGTLRPSDIRRMHKHARQHSGASSKSTHTVTIKEDPRPTNRHRTGSVRDDARQGRGRSESLTSLAPTMGSSDRGRELGLKRAREVEEYEVREDLVAWRLPGSRA